MQFLIYSGITFWVLVGIVVICIIYSVADDYADKEGGSLATFSLLAFLVLTFLFGNKDYYISGWNWIITHILSVIGIIASYFFLGILWSIVKWATKMRKYKKKRYNSSSVIDAGDYKGLIVSWISYWPFSFVWFLINDPLKNFGNWIFDGISKTYQNIADSILGTKQ